MKQLQTIADKTAISLSFICTLHCLAVPFAVALLPTFAAINLEDEAFHLWMIAAVIPTSLLALSMGCKKHRDYRVLLLGIAGLSLLIFAAFFGHDLLGERGETAFTVFGAIIIATGHLLNHRLCQHSHCECHAER
ncbi:MAG: MerC domain-containing protein [Oceanicoccus sp.]|uniref:MerC domain-containing protein n=1 Tax=Oceanicoccus sp. TaxID=2691044 RepID=UPI002615C44D|nr:MerC domain-containing protein [Oceanicoccus sp.]MCP3908899.1 MerC domain-containing protein [Oceanicoccus sp.]